MTSPRIRRRTVLLGATAGLGVATTSGCMAGRASSIPSTVPMAPADALPAFYGIGVHLHHATESYSDHELVKKWVSRLGARRVRTRLSPRPEVLDTFEELAANGVKVHAVCGALGSKQSAAGLMRVIQERFADPTTVFAAFEGINEPNNKGVDWVDETRAKTQELARARDAAGLATIPIVAPALARVIGGGHTTEDDARELGDLSEWVDYGNMHVYPRGRQPSVDIEYFARSAAHVSGPRPIMCTEGGYFTAAHYSGGASQVPAEVAAAYAPQMLLEHWRAGSAGFFRYELLDEPGISGQDREASLGTVVPLQLGWLSFGMPKPDFFTVQTILRLFDDPGPEFEPGPWPLKVEGPSDLRWAGFERRDGTRLVALWLDRSIHDPSSGVTVDLDQPLDSVVLDLPDARPITVTSLYALDEEEMSTNSTHRLTMRAGVTVVTVHS